MQFPITGDSQRNRDMRDAFAHHALQTLQYIARCGGDNCLACKRAWETFEADVHYIKAYADAIKGE